MCESGSPSNFSGGGSWECPGFEYHGFRLKTVVFEDSLCAQRSELLDLSGGRLGSMFNKKYQSFAVSVGNTDGGYASVSQSI